MNIALCLYGHLRTFELCWEGIYQKLIKPYNPDIFAMTWTDSIGLQIEPEQCMSSLYHPGYHLSSSPVDLGVIEGMINCTKPVGLHLDNFNLHINRFKELTTQFKRFGMPFAKHRPLGVFGLMHSRSAVITLKKQQEVFTGKKYDYVIATRWDVLFEQDIDLTILNPDILTYNGFYKDKYAILHDLWVSGNSQSMDIWADIYNNLNRFADLNLYTFDPHKIYTDWLKYNGVKWDINANIPITSKRMLSNQ